MSETRDKVIAYFKKHPTHSTRDCADSKGVKVSHQRVTQIMKREVENGTFRVEERRLVYLGE